MSLITIYGGRDMNKEMLEKDYFNDLNKIKETIRQNQNKAMVYVNSQMIMTYYEIGTIINQRKTWGSKYIENLAKDLKEYGKGFSRANLFEMMKFASNFTYDDIIHQPGGQIPWRIIIEVMSKSKTHDEMIWYINATHKNGWSRAMVMNQIEMKAYERSLIEPDTTDIVKSDDSLKELFKDTIVIDFLDKNNTLDKVPFNAVVTLLEDKETNFCLMVANTHRHWDPAFKDVKLVQ